MAWGQAGGDRAAAPAESAELALAIPEGSARKTPRDCSVEVFPPETRAARALRPATSGDQSAGPKRARWEPGGFGALVRGPFTAGPRGLCEISEPGSQGARTKGPEPPPCGEGRASCPRAGQHCASTLKVSGRPPASPGGLPTGVISCLQPQERGLVSLSLSVLRGEVGTAPGRAGAL